MKIKHLISLKDLTKEDFYEIFALAKKIKEQPQKFEKSLKGKTLAMLFSKPSTRTRVSFEVGMYELGGYAIYLPFSDIQIQRGETLSDTAKVLSRYADGIMARVHSHHEIETLAQYSDVPVINGLSDFTHPCQGLCDYFTILEKKGGFNGVKLAYVGDCNNVCHSLIFGGVILGVEIRIASPENYSPSNRVIEIVKNLKQEGCLKIFKDPKEAVLDADIIYTDVWASMGMEAEKEKRKEIFKNYQVNKELLNFAKKDVLFMHCLPAHRGEEVTDDVIDSKNSIVLDQAENRLHVQKALLLLMMGK